MSLQKPQYVLIPIQISQKTIANEYFIQGNKCASVKEKI